MPERSLFPNGSAFAYSLQISGPLGKTLVITHLEFTANPWTLLVNHTFQSVAVQGRTPAILQPSHAPPTPLVYCNILFWHSCIRNKHYF